MPQNRWTSLFFRREQMFLRRCGGISGLKITWRASHPKKEGGCDAKGYEILSGTS
jgi:hypothetical protein